MAQWLGLSAIPVWGPGSILVCGTKTPTSLNAQPKNFKDHRFKKTGLRAGSLPTELSGKP